MHQGNIHIALCDDDLKYLAYSKECLLALAQKQGVHIEISEYTSADKMIFEVEDLPHWPDIIYLDIKMPGTDGVTAAHKLREQGCTSEIIFFTISKNHIIEGYDVEALHYIIKKEITEDKFEEIFTRAVQKVLNKEQESITFSCAGEIRTIKIKDILHFEVKDHIITVYYGKENFEFYTTMDKIEKTLWGRGFVRTHRAYLVAISAVASMASKDITLKDGTLLPLGRAYSAKVRAEIKI